MLLDVVEDEVEGLGLLAVVADGSGGAATDLAGNSTLVILALAQPLANVLPLLDLQEGDVVGLAEGGNELLVLGIFAILGEDAEESLLAVECLDDLVETLDDTVVGEGLLQNVLGRCVDVVGLFLLDDLRLLNLLLITL